MKKIPFDKDDLLPEYQLDYGKAKPNRFATGERTVVVLDEELSKVFKTPNTELQRTVVLTKSQKPGFVGGECPEFNKRVALVR
jgi:hypothetical protein